MPWESEHTTALQRSKYLVIENDVEQLNKTYRGGNDIAKKFTLRYCLPDEVMRKKKKSLMFKTSFLIKVKNL